MEMVVECFPVGELEANCYFVADPENGESLIIDPGAYSPVVDNKIESFGSDKLKYILLTHGHFDHIGYASQLRKKYPQAKIVISKSDSAFTNNDMLNLSAYFGGSLEHFNADILVDDGTELSFGKMTIKVIATPGHTSGSVCYLLGNNLFTGDTIMKNTTGRMDFPTGDSAAMFRSVKRIAGLEGNLKLYCGHGESTTLEYERENNIAMGKSFYDDLY